MNEFIELHVTWYDGNDIIVKPRMFNKIYIMQFYAVPKLSDNASAEIRVGKEYFRVIETYDEIKSKL